MDDREKLVELLNNSFAEQCEKRGLLTAPHTATDLIAHGVTVQEQNGCEYCKEDSEGFRRMFGAFYLVNPFHGKTWQIHAGKCKPREIYFCPMCGRRLPRTAQC